MKATRTNTEGRENMEKKKARPSDEAIADLMDEVRRFIETCGYGGSNRGTENSHAKQLAKYAAALRNETK